MFILAIFVGFEVISKVPSMLHTPLMSGTNAIHGIILFGGILVLADARRRSPRCWGLSPSFLVRPTSSAASWSRTGCCKCSRKRNNMITIALILIGVAVLFILGIKFLSSPKTARDWKSRGGCGHADRLCHFEQTGRRQHLGARRTLITRSSSSASSSVSSSARSARIR